MRSRLPKSKLAVPDLPSLGLILILVGFGLLMIFEASVVEAYHELNNEWYFIFGQIKFSIIALFFSIIAFLMPKTLVKKLSLPFFLVVLLLLIVVLVPGIGQKIQGARRWIDLGPFNLQPAELAKLSLILYLSAWLEKSRPARSVLVLIISLLGLIMLEPDMGTGIVISSIALSMYFISGIDIKKLFKIIGLGLVGLIMLIAFAPYRLNRVKTFLNPLHDPLGVSYHSRQVLISLGSGGLFGKGLGNSRQKYQYLPEASTDSIFAVIGEEFGFIGGTAIILLYLLLIIRLFSIALTKTETYDQLLTFGVGTWVTTQFLLNMGAMTAIVPLTGVPLPLLSYGGSSLVTMSVGLALAIKRDP